jgi:hypothetical protein
MNRAAQGRERPAAVAPDGSEQVEGHSVNRFITFFVKVIVPMGISLCIAGGTITLLVYIRGGDPEPIQDGKPTPDLLRHMVRTGPGRWSEDQYMIIHDQDTGADYLVVPGAGIIKLETRPTFTKAGVEP